MLKVRIGNRLLVQFFRFADEKIIEEWEVSNEVPNQILNANGAF